MFRNIISRGWFPLLITAVAAASIYYDVSINIVVPVLAGLLCVGLAGLIINTRKGQLELLSMKLTQLAEYFNRRFMGHASFTIFTVIEGLFGVENKTIWEWARACDMSKRIFDSWSDSFTSRVESDLRARRFANFFQTHLNELWSLNNHYYDFVEQFYEIAAKYEVAPSVIDDYRKFILEYNGFVERFREAITELRKVARTPLEAPGVKLAPEPPAKKAVV
jgi:hypothetical protein